MKGEDGAARFRRNFQYGMKVVVIIFVKTDWVS